MIIRFRWRLLEKLWVMKVQSKDGQKTYEYDYKMILVYGKVRTELKKYCKDKKITYTQAITNWLRKEK
jgi:hypothetical protein